MEAPANAFKAGANPFVDAGVAELVDAPDLGSGAKSVGVRVPSPAPVL